ncbi:MAG: hypothetical protein ACK4ML_01000 [Alishewanella aestuarii]
MFAQLETLKKLNAKLVSLLKRRITILEQIELAVKDDAAAREKLTDMNLSTEDFTKYSNEARSAQRRRANLHDKMIDIEDAVQSLYSEMIDALNDAKAADYPATLETEVVDLEETAYDPLTGEATAEEEAA